MLPSLGNTSVLEKSTKLLTPHLMTLTHQNKHYHVICVQNWHSSESTNHHSCKVTYRDRTLIHRPTCHNVHYVFHTQLTLITTLTVESTSATQHHYSVEKAFRSSRGYPNVEIYSRLAFLRT